MNASEWAAWVQAVGSIIAIAGSTFAVWWNHDLEKNRDQEDLESSKKATLRTAAQLASGGYQALMKTMNVAEKNKERSEAIKGVSDMRSIRDCLKSLSIKDFDDFETISKVAAVIGMLDASVSLGEIYIREIDVHPVSHEYFLLSVKSIKSELYDFSESLCRAAGLLD